MDFNSTNLPLGLGMALAMDENAQRRFNGLSETEKEHIILKCKDARSKEEMDKIVDSISPEEDIKGLVDGGSEIG